MADFPPWAKVAMGTVVFIITVLAVLNSIHAPVEAVEELRKENLIQDSANIDRQALLNVQILRRDKAVAQKLLKKDATDKYFLEQQKAEGVPVDERRLKHLQDDLPKQEREVEEIDAEIDAALELMGKKSG